MLLGAWKRKKFHLLHDEMKLLLDMNLSPTWVEIFQREGFLAIHWPAVGERNASDEEIVKWAKQNNYVILTYDLDFSTILALTHSSGPSVVLFRGRDLIPSIDSLQIITALRTISEPLLNGAIASIDEQNCRIRILPI